MLFSKPSSPMKTSVHALGAAKLQFALKGDRPLVVDMVLLLLLLLMVVRVVVAVVTY
jgi:hypothetical protein